MHHSLPSLLVIIFFEAQDDNAGTPWSAHLGFSLVSWDSVLLYGLHPPSFWGWGVRGLLFKSPTIPARLGLSITKVGVTPGGCIANGRYFPGSYHRGTGRNQAGLYLAARLPPGIVC